MTNVEPPAILQFAKGEICCSVNMQSFAKEMPSIEISCQKFSQCFSCQTVSAQETLKLTSLWLVFPMWSEVPHPYFQEFVFLFLKLEILIYTVPPLDLIFWPLVINCFREGTTNLFTTLNDSVMKELLKEAGK